MTVTIYILTLLIASEWIIAIICKPLESYINQAYDGKLTNSTNLVSVYIRLLDY